MDKNREKTKNYTKFKAYIELFMVVTLIKLVGF